jgi:hypothetical protein
LIPPHSKASWDPQVKYVPALPVTAKLPAPSVCETRYLAQLWTS